MFVCLSLVGGRGRSNFCDVNCARRYFFNSFNYLLFGLKMTKLRLEFKTFQNMMISIRFCRLCTYSENDTFFNFSLLNISDTFLSTMVSTFPCCNETESFLVYCGGLVYYPSINLNLAVRTIRNGNTHGQLDK